MIVISTFGIKTTNTQCCFILKSMALETSASLVPYGGQSTLSNYLIKPNLCVTEFIFVYIGRRSYVTVSLRQ